MTKAIAEQILIQDCFPTKNGKKAALKTLSRKGATLLNENYVVLDGISYQIIIDHKANILTLRAF